MTSDWLATEDGKKAVEAMVYSPRLEFCRDSGEEGHTCHDCTVAGMWHDAEMSLRAALPHLDRMFRERYAAALESHEAMMVAIASLEQYPDGRGRLCADLAAFLRREPTL